MAGKPEMVAEKESGPTWEDKAMALHSLIQLLKKEGGDDAHRHGYILVKADMMIDAKNKRDLECA